MIFLKIQYFLLLAFSFILLGCSDSTYNKLNSTITDASCYQISKDLLGCDFKEAVCSGEERHFTDKLGDVKKTFIDLTNMKLTIGDDCIGVTLTMANLPETLIFNHKELADDANNYTWSAFFDVDNNDKPSKGDLIIGVGKDKLDINQELKGRILKNTQKTITEIESMTYKRVNSHVTAFISATISGNSFNIYLPKSLHSSLEKITTSTKINFYTQFNNGKTRYRDSYPDI